MQFASPMVNAVSGPASRAMNLVKQLTRLTASPMTSVRPSLNGLIVDHDAVD